MSTAAPVFSCSNPPYSFAPQSAVSPSVATIFGGSHALHRLCPIKIDASCFDDMNGKIRKIGINIYEQNMGLSRLPFWVPPKTKRRRKLSLLRVTWKFFLLLGPETKLHPVSESPMALSTPSNDENSDHSPVWQTHETWNAHPSQIFNNIVFKWQYPKQQWNKTGLLPSTNKQHKQPCHKS